MPSYYEVLGVERTADPEEIKRAYRRLAKQVHPDTGGSAALFRLINEAYEALTDPHRRSEYNKEWFAPPTRAGIAVPSLAGMTREQALELLRRVGLTGQVFAQRVSFSDSRGGRVVSQAPPPGTAAEVGAVVKVIVALNSLPDLVGGVKKAGGWLARTASLLNMSGNTYLQAHCYETTLTDDSDWNHKIHLGAAHAWRDVLNASVPGSSHLEYGWGPYNVSEHTWQPWYFADSSRVLGPRTAILYDAQPGPASGGLNFEWLKFRDSETGFWFSLDFRHREVPSGRMVARLRHDVRWGDLHRTPHTPSVALIQMVP